MLPRRRENSDQEKQFSFSGPLAMQSSDDQFETWAERIKSDHHGHFGRASNVKVGAWAKRSTAYVNPDEGEFRGLGRKEDHEDVPSPPLWGSRSPAEAYPMLGLTMRSQMMARYRKEMIDLVRDVPENAYELSLRDIVEVNPRPVLKTSELEVKGEEKKEKEKKKKKGGRRIMSRSESLDTGLLLRMFVPTTMRRKKSFGAAGSVTCSKVSPKPVVADGGGEILEKGPDGEWWKKKDIDELKSSSSSGSSSGGSTTTSSGSSSSSSNNNNNKSSSNSSNTGRRKKSRCLPFVNFCKSKTRGA